jgi:hypothetical protein
VGRSGSGGFSIRPRLPTSAPSGRRAAAMASCGAGVPLARWPLQPYDQAMDKSSAISPFPPASGQPGRLTACGHGVRGAVPSNGGDRYCESPPILRNGPKPRHSRSRTRLPCC